MSRIARPVEGLVWVKDAVQIIVVNVRGQTAHLLAGDEMAVWDWLSLGYSFHKTARLLAELQKTPLKDAEASLEKMLQGWIAAGLLEITEPRHG
jgi:hypothetical protein